MTMFIAALILLMSTAMLFFYVQATCERILSREFDQDYFQSIVNANRLEFPFVREAVEQFEVSADYSRFRTMLKCDFLALTYLLKNAANKKRRFTFEDRLLISNFHLISLSLSLRRALGFAEKPALAKLSRILQYFANVIGRRVSEAGAADLSVSEYLMSL